MPGARLVSWAIKFLLFHLIFLGSSAWNMLLVTFMAPRTLENLCTSGAYALGFSLEMVITNTFSQNSCRREQYRMNKAAMREALRSDCAELGSGC
jgi:hypothetical protein